MDIPIPLYWVSSPQLGSIIPWIPETTRSLFSLLKWIIQNDAIFEAGSTFSKTHHFSYQFVQFRGCRVMVVSNPVPNYSVKSNSSKRNSNKNSGDRQLRLVVYPIILPGFFGTSQRRFARISRTINSISPFFYENLK